MREEKVLVVESFRVRTGSVPPSRHTKGWLDAFITSRHSLIHGEVHALGPAWFEESGEWRIVWQFPDRATAKVLVDMWRADVVGTRHLEHSLVFGEKHDPVDGLPGL